VPVADVDLVVSRAGRIGEHGARLVRVLVGKHLDLRVEILRIDVVGRQDPERLLCHLLRSRGILEKANVAPVPAGAKYVECAMRVKRTKDGGNLSPSRPSSPCSCLFELKATGVTTCAACTVQGDCGANESCSQGYCEK
jgi:hypothetical protein